jgi:hypothetical protein
VSRYREYRRIKAMLLRYGFSERILEPLARSRCQRDAALLAANEAGHGDCARAYFTALGYRPARRDCAARQRTPNAKPPRPRRNPQATPGTTRPATCPATTHPGRSPAPWPARSPALRIVSDAADSCSRPRDAGPFPLVHEAQQKWPASKVGLSKALTKANLAGG